MDAADKDRGDFGTTRARRGGWRWLRFGLATLLFGVLCASGFLAGYRRGYDAGREKRQHGTYLAEVYHVVDLLDAQAGPTPDFAPLIKVIQDTVDPTSWDGVGGPGRIQAFSDNQSIVVYQNAANHEKIEKLLADLHRQPGPE
ncbi:MAG: hypothetical protein WD847_12440 [Pirellulales bacterium]